MHIIICLSNEDGMLFHGRRQSKDRRVLEDIIKLTRHSKLYMNHYSESMFQDYETKNIIIEDEYLNKAEKDSYCFVENETISNFDEVQSITIYRWNRSYPADFYFQKIPDEYHQEESMEFKGYSHDNITREIYVK